MCEIHSPSATANYLDKVLSKPNPPVSDLILLGAGYDSVLAAVIREEVWNDPDEELGLCQWCGEGCDPCDILCQSCRNTVICYSEMPAPQLALEAR